MNDYDLIISNKKYCKASIKGKSLVYNQCIKELRDYINGGRVSCDENNVFTLHYDYVEAYESGFGAYEFTNTDFKEGDLIFFDLEILENLPDGTDINEMLIATWGEDSGMGHKSFDPFNTKKISGLLRVGSGKYILLYPYSNSSGNQPQLVNQTFKFRFQVVNLTKLHIDNISIEDFYSTDLFKFIVKGSTLPYSVDNAFLHGQTPFRITKDIMYNNFLSFGNGNITDTSGNIVITDNKDGSYTINGNNTSSSYSYAYFCAVDTKTILNHKIIFGFMNDVLSQTDNEEKVWFFDENTGDKTKNLVIKRFTSSNDFVCSLQLKGNYNFNNVVVRPFFIDLTILGLDDITTREDFYKTYLGKLVLSCASLPYTEKNIAYGKNLFNVYEGLDVENIEHSVENGRVEVEYSYYNEFGSFCKQYIKVKPNTKYTFNCDYIGGNRVVIAIYDNDKNNISGSTNIGDNLTYLSGYSGYYGTCENNTFTTPNNCEYVRIGFCKMNDVGLARWNVYSHIKLEEGNCKTNYTRYEEDMKYGIGTIKYNQIIKLKENIYDDFGITITNNNDGSITINGTATTNIIDHILGYGVYVGDITNLNVNRKYYFNVGSSEETSDLNTSIYINDYESIDLTQKEMIFSPQGTTSNLRFTFTIYQGKTFDNLVVKPILIDLTACGLENVSNLNQLKETDLYKYIQKNVLDYSVEPITIENIKLYKGTTFNTWNVVKTSKNLFAWRDELSSLEGFANITPRNFKDNVYYIGLSRNNYYANDNVDLLRNDKNNREFEIKVNNVGYGLAYPFKLESGKTYTISCNCIAPEGSDCFIGISYYDTNGNIITYEDYFRVGSGVLSKTITPPSNCLFTCFNFSGTNGNTYTFYDIQLEEGNQMTTYQKHFYPSFCAEKITTTKLVSASSLSWWWLRANEYRHYTYSLSTEIKIPENQRNKANIISTKFKTMSSYDIWRDGLPTTENVNTICVGDGGFIGIKLDGSTSRDNALKDVDILYPLNEPIKYPIDSIMIPRDTTSVICENGLELEIVKN